MPEQGTKMNRCNTKPRFLGDFMVGEEIAGYLAIEHGGMKQQE